VEEDGYIPKEDKIGDERGQPTDEISGDEREQPRDEIGGGSDRERERNGPR